MKIIQQTCTNENLWHEIEGEITPLLNLPKKDLQRFKNDYINAINYYTEQGVPESEIKRRLSSDKLGNFYADIESFWFPLDYAAKIYPATMKRDQMTMFRLSATLKKDIVPEILQMALNFTIKRFPSFSGYLRHGVFWHYIEGFNRRFIIEEETGIPCQTMKIARTGAQLLHIFYFKKRISVEFFHILTDGHGGMIFLKTLVAEYLRLLGEDILCDNGVWDINETPDPAETANDYHEIKDCNNTGGFMNKMAAQMNGKVSKVTPCRIISFDMDSAAVKEAARRYGVTVTAYILGVQLLAGKQACAGKKGIFSVQVPIDVREVYGSKTLLNFDLYCSIGLDLEDITTMEEILPKISQQLKDGTNRGRLDAMMNSTMNLVRFFKFIPTFIVSPIASAFYAYLSDMPFTSSLSNLGVIKVPEQMKAHVEKFDFVLGGNSICRSSCALNTFEGHTVFNISKMTPVDTFEEAFARQLDADSISYKITGSMLYED